MFKRKSFGGEREEGSITVFLSLTLVLILSFLFSLLEAARVNGLQQIAEQKLVLQLESVFGGSSSILWERYRLLLLDGSFGTGKPDIFRLERHIMEESQGQEPEENMYRIYLKDIEISSYMLATDQGGNAFYRQAVIAGKEAAAQNLEEGLKEEIIQGGKLKEKSRKLTELWENAKDARQEAEEKRAGAKQDAGKEQESMKGGAEGLKTDTELPENPMEYAELLKKSSLISLVLGDTTELSSKAVLLNNTVEKRQLYCGNMDHKTEGAVDKLWFLQYLSTYFCCQQYKKQEESALDYELEYCIGGRERDSENLEKVLQKILLLRQAGNFITILQDREKQTLAGNIAMAAVGFTGILPLIEAVKYGILIAWSYVESILDLRCILAGGKVSLIKKTSEWRSDLYHLKDAPEGEASWKDQKGLSYKEYLMVLLALMPEKTLICRTMDIVENNLRLLPYHEQFRMDTMMAAVKAEAVYTADGLFFNLFPGKRSWDNTYYLKAEKTIICQK